MLRSSNDRQIETNSSLWLAKELREKGQGLKRVSLKQNVMRQGTVTRLNNE